MTQSNVIGAFSEEDASVLSGVSRAQLRHWHRTGLLEATMGPHGAQGAYQRIYSFRELVALRVLNRLRNEFNVPLQELRKVSSKLEHLGDSKWTACTLYVLGKRVVFDDPASMERKEVVSGQRVLDIPISAAISDTHEAIRLHNRRPNELHGQVTSRKFVQSSEEVFAGTRIPISIVGEYIGSGFGVDDILADFPDLSEEDIDSVRNSNDGHAA